MCSYLLGHHVITYKHFQSKPMQFTLILSFKPKKVHGVHESKHNETNHMDVIFK